MTRALVDGLGVGIVPLYLPRPGLCARRLRRIQPIVLIEPHFFRVVYRQDRNLDEPMNQLAHELRRTGLR